MSKHSINVLMREQTLELNEIFQDAMERGNEGVMNDVINDLAYGTEHNIANPAQAFVLLKAKARSFDEGSMDFDNALVFMADLIADQDVNAGNQALLASLKSQDRGEDLLKRIASGDFRALDDDDKIGFTQGFEAFEKADARRIVAYAKQALEEIRLTPPVPVAEDDHQPVMK